jgi:hypothetical protein
MKRSGSLWRVAVVITAAACIAIFNAALIQPLDDSKAGTKQQTLPPPRRTAKPLLPLLPDDLSSPEEDGLLRQWNVPYHATRLSLREDQTMVHAGPLHEHTFFTTDCTRHSLWQALSLEHSWAHVHAVGGGGFMSRVVSGCAKAQHKQPDMSRHIIPSKEGNGARADAHSRGRVPCAVTVDDGCFGVYFVPEYHHLPSGEFYAPFNRPNGIWFWLNHTDLTEDVFVLLDPDMIYLSRLYGAGGVKPGRPSAQFYTYMDFDRLGTYECPLCARPGSFDRHKFAVGPPWMIALSDLRGIMRTWVALVPMLRAQDPNSWIVEMVAYAVACAYHNLPHALLMRGMVDNVMQPEVWNGTYLVGHELRGVERELLEIGKSATTFKNRSRISTGTTTKSRLQALRAVTDAPSRVQWWRTASAGWFARRLNGSGVGMFRDGFDSQVRWWDAAARLREQYDDDESKHPVALLHYCYTWELGESAPPDGPHAAEQHKRIVGRETSTLHPVVDYFHWSKYRTPTDWPGGKAKFAHNLLSCDCPLLQEFHTLWAVDNPNFQWRRTATFLHLGLPAINEALRAFKVKYCAPAEINFSERLRTSHPSYWESRYDIWDYRKSDGQGKNVKDFS